MNQNDSGAGCADIICDNIIIVVLTMCDLALSVFAQKLIKHSKQCAVKSSNVRLD